MGSGFFNVGVSGLNAAQMGLMTTAHNIANASTPGFNRQYVVQSNNTPVFTGGGFLGTGAGVDTVRRVYNEFLAGQARSAETSVAELETYGNLIAQIDNLLADPSAGVSPTLQGFFAAVSDLASTPNSIPARQAMLSATQALAARFQAVDQQLTVMRDGVNTQVFAQVTTINSMVSQIAEINQRIIIAQAAGPGQPANDLHDQRDQLVNELNKEIRINVQVETDGSYSLFFGTGQPLLVGVQTYGLKAQSSREDLAQIDIGLVSPNGQVISIPESLVNGGKLGGLLQFRSQTLDLAQNSLGRVALAITTTVNEQHRLGQDLQGLPGGDFFRNIQPAVLGAPTNTGFARVSASAVSSDYRLEFDGSQYKLTRLADDTTRFFGGLPIVADGLRIGLAGGSFAGTPTNPDTFLIRPSAAPQERVTALAGNAGTATIVSSGSNLQTLGTSDFRLAVVGSNQLMLTRISDGQTWTGVGATQDDAIANLMQQAAPVGFDLAVSGAMAIGDSFLIRPTRYAARDLALAIDDPRSIAAAMAMRTAAAAENGGTGAISNGEVVATRVPLATSFAVRYDASSDSLVGFPVGSRVMLGSQVFAIDGATTRVPFVAGAAYTIADKSFSIAATPLPNESFAFDPLTNSVVASGPTAATIIDAAIPISSLPARDIALTYRQANASVSPALPARLEGFPAGSRVTLTTPDGKVREFLMNPTDSTPQDFVDFVPNSTIEFNGVRFRVSGAPVEGDRFFVGANPAGSGDARNLLAIGALQMKNTLGDGTASFQAAYSQMVSQVGNKAREVEVTRQAQQNLVKQANSAMQSASGVNLDEEAANLLRYQQAYQAAAKMMSVASTLFDSILQLGR